MSDHIPMSGTRTERARRIPSRPLGLLAARSGQGFHGQPEMRC